jgi:5-methylcytosine-specific restriction endonuclease McrA
MRPIPFEPRKSADFAHRALTRSIRAEEQARQCAVLWFGEIMKRRLYRDLGYSSINQYARRALGFSKTRTGDYVQLAKKLERLPAVRESVASGELGYTKAREVVKVADAANEKEWLDEAKKSSRRQLEVSVARAKQKANRPDQPTLVPEPALPKASPPVRVSLDMTPEQFARFEMLMEALAKGGRVGDRTELVLEGLAALAEEEKAPRGARADGAPFQVHVHECPECGSARVATGRGEWEVDRLTRERARCDGQVLEEGKRNRATIPPAVRRMVLARDRHRCRTPGCGHTRFLEVHHVKPRAEGGGHESANLVTLCSACHRLAHEKGGAIPVVDTG